MQSDGAPISYEWTSQTEKTNSARILFANGVAKITLQMQGAHTFEQDLTFGSPLIAVLDDNLSIACSEGVFRPLRLQRPGRGPLETADFLRGFPIAAGTVLPCRATS